MYIYITVWGCWGRCIYMLGLVYIYIYIYIHRPQHPQTDCQPLKLLKSRPHQVRSFHRQYRFYITYLYMLPHKILPTNFFEQVCSFLWRFHGNGLNCSLQCQSNIYSYVNYRHRYTESGFSPGSGTRGLITKFKGDR